MNPLTVPWLQRHRPVMWRNTPLLIVVALAALLAVGWQRYGSMTAALDSLSGASLLVDSDGWNLGRVSMSETRISQLRLLNRSKQAIAVIGGKVTCSCVHPDPLPITLQPGESRNFGVRFHPKAKAGPVSETLALFTDDPHRPLVRINVHADVVPDNVP